MTLANVDTRLRVIIPLWKAFEATTMDNATLEPLLDEIDTNLVLGKAPRVGRTPSEPGCGLRQLRRTC